MFIALKVVASKLKHEIQFYKKVYSHPNTPLVSKILLGCALAYAASPIDLIPDFIPILGHLDDAVLIPLLIIVSLKFVPDSVKDECKLSTSAQPKNA